MFYMYISVSVVLFIIDEWVIYTPWPVRVQCTCMFRWKEKEWYLRVCVYGECACVCVCVTLCVCVCVCVCMCVALYVCW